MKNKLALSFALLQALVVTSLAADIQLPLVPSGAMQKIGGYIPQKAITSGKPPASLKRAPADLSAPAYGEIKFGPKESPSGVLFLIDEPAGKPWRLFVDVNVNGDLTDDPPAEWAMREVKGRDGKSYQQGSGSAMLALSAADSSSAVRVAMYRFDQSDPARPKDALFYYPDYARIGSVEIGGKKLSAILHDELARGDFRDAAAVLKLDVNEDGKFDFRSESFKAGKPFNIGGTTYEVTGATATGSSFQIVKSAQSVPETKPLAVVLSGKPAPAFEATTITGQKISMPGSYKGKIVLLDFWATWCGPCIGELPNLIKAYETHHAKGFEVLGISLDSGAKVATLPDFLKARNMTWPQVCDGKGWEASIGQLYSVHSIPAAFLIDGTTGIVLATQGLRGTQLSDTVEAALSKKLTPENAATATASRKPVSLSNATLTGSKWTGGANFWIEFRANGDYREFWRGGEYPGTWKVLSEKEVSVSREDGWDYVFKPTADGALLRFWQPKSGQEQQQNLVFQPMTSPNTASADTSRNHMFEMMRIAATDHDGALKTIFEGIKNEPLKTPWGLEVTMIFTSDERRAVTLKGAERTKHFTQCRDYILSARTLVESALIKHPGNESLIHDIGKLDDSLARASLEIGETAKARELATKQLATNTDTKSWNYGNIIHQANSTLGRAALRDGDKKAAADFLKKAGATPGSPQLNSFGPDWTLAREMVEAGETQAVLDYFDLVEKFWAKPKSGSSSSASLSDRHKQKLDQWRAEVRAGKVPDFRP